MIYLRMTFDALPRRVVPHDAASAIDDFILYTRFVSLCGRLSIDNLPYLASADRTSLGALLKGQ